MSLKANFKTLAFAGAFAVSTLLAGAASAQELSADPNEVVARVNGSDITRADLEDVNRELASQLQRVPADQRFSVILNVLIDIRLMARAAEAEGLDNDPLVQRRLVNSRDNQLREEYLRVKAFEPITEETVTARFEAEVAGFEPEDEVRARHILVADEADARAIIEQLDGGADFSALATEKSTDPGSGRNGGDLGFFTRGDMVPAFSDAAFALEPGSYTKEPVQSQFGYHIILVDEVRKQPAPSFAARADQLRQDMLSEALVAASEKLRADATVEIRGPDGELVPMDASN